MSLRARQVPRVGNQQGLPIVVTEVQHGAVDTATLTPESPLLREVRRILVASPMKAAKPDPPSCSEPDEARVRHEAMGLARASVRLLTATGPTVSARRLGGSQISTGRQVSFNSACPRSEASTAVIDRRLRFHRPAPTAVAKSVTTSAVHSSSSASSSRRFVTTLVTSFVSRRRSVGAALDLSSLSVVPSAMPDGLVTSSGPCDVATAHRPRNRW